MVKTHSDDVLASLGELQKAGQLSPGKQPPGAVEAARNSAAARRKLLVHPKKTRADDSCWCLRSSLH